MKKLVIYIIPKEFFKIWFLLLLFKASKPRYFLLEMMLQEEIGQRIKRFRIEKGITQRELATRASLSKGYISQLEKGLTLPSLPNLKEILDVLGITLSEFFSEKNPLKVVYSKKDKITLPSTSDGIRDRKSVV